jgi:hypothetical protein
MKQLYRSASRFFEEAFARRPALAADPSNIGTRFAAARLAALAGCGQGKEAGSLDAKGRTHWRMQALKWLEANLIVLSQRLQSGKPQDRNTAASHLRRWQQHKDLAGIRDAALLAKLPPAEQEACGRLWAEVGAVLREAQGKASARAP